MLTLGQNSLNRDLDIVHAHKHCVRNRAELQRSKLCGCFGCSAVYSPLEIESWTDDDQTAICARCLVDSVIGDASGYPITKEFLERMHAFCF